MSRVVVFILCSLNATIDVPTTFVFLILVLVQIIFIDAIFAPLHRSFEALYDVRGKDRRQRQDLLPANNLLVLLVNFAILTIASASSS
jgi:hypothetical protein